MPLTDDDVAQIRELIREELHAAGLPAGLTFRGEGKQVTVLKLPEQTIYASNDILTPDVLDHIEAVIMARLVHAITVRRAGLGAL